MKDNTLDLIFWVGFTLIALLVGIAVGLEIGERKTESRAVKAGAAEYVITDPSTGAVEFRYKGFQTKGAQE